MKVIRKILYGVIGFIALILIAALLVDKKYTVEREITINKPRTEVFNYIRYLKNQDNYSKWVRTDPNMKKAFKGTDGTVGFVYAWNGNNEAGQGEQEIKNLTEGEKLEVEVRFIRPFASTGYAPMTTETLSPTQTKVTWAMTGGNPYPLNLMHLFMDDLLGKDLETSLGTLKTVLEKSKG